MSQTPRTEAGQLTELTMLAVRERLPDISTHQYNRIYEAVLETLNFRFGTDGRKLGTAPAKEGSAS